MSHKATHREELDKQYETCIFCMFSISPFDIVKAIGYIDLDVDCVVYYTRQEFCHFA